MIDELDRELRRVGVGPMRRRRIVAELRDHHASDPSADLGDAQELAQQFADELGTHGARRSTLLGFAGLVAAACVYILAVSPLAFGTALLSASRSAAGGVQGLGTGFVLLFGLGLIVAPQIATVSGVLGAVRVFRHRHERTLPRAEVHVVLRRAITALVAGVLTMVSVLAAALAEHHTRSTLPVVVFASCAAIILCVFATRAVAALRVQVAVPGAAGWLADDVRGLLPAAVTRHPWRMALLTSLAAGVAVWMAGVVQADGYDGALRGLAEAVACFVSFCVFGDALALRPHRGADDAGPAGTALA